MLYKLEFHCKKTHIILFEEILGEDHLGVSTFEQKENPDQWHIEVLFDFSPNLQVLNYLFKETSEKEGIETPHLSLSLVPEIDWLSENRKAFPPLTIGNFYVYGSHHEEPIPQGKISFKIDAATAFGTGQHATTQGCLLALEKLKEEKYAPLNPLDLGCGTGILGMAIARLFNINVTMSDNDIEAVEKATSNVFENDLKSQVTCYLSEGFQSEILKNKALYDLITANILADPLILLASDMDRYVSEKGIIILSGLLATQAEAVGNAYKAFSFKEIDRYPIDEWMTLVLKKI
ncbi:MAG: 50S ribosomal protein L11 methyltransferase [Candidatus Paracaedimonas acanthamoebae]|uniref:Ribosomal protein L11 methyltransferase n=1 Tax=Candidatus Paracaedimonas acanthamoebae TaxID=244581 RepID=A0A8J7PIM5_9PROT|nr:50S ribosomal protein L11 methyltransferase [Candidatus Paracaedimonas acanthamoebae]